VRIASGKKLILISFVVAALLTWYEFSFWKFGVGLLTISAFSTILEFWGYKKHDRAIAELSNHT
jgi:hypothetical protein